jgi:putative endonuclease
VTKQSSLEPERRGYVYILFNRPRGSLYTGVTSNLVARAYQHRTHQNDGFTRRYGVVKLGYYEVFDLIVDAIAREKQIKGGSRAKKIELIESKNPDWKDLFAEII